MANANDYLPPTNAKWPHWTDKNIETWQTMWANRAILMPGSPAQNPSLGWRSIFSKTQPVQRAGTEGSITTGDGAILDPVLGDLASVSSDLLFGEPFKVKLSVENQEFQTYINKTVLRMMPDLSEAAEISAALGGVFAKINWRADLLPYPYLEPIHPLRAKGFFWGNHLYATTVWTELEPLKNPDIVWRLFEVHYRQLNETTGNYSTLVEFFLARGEKDNVGRYVPLTSHPHAAIFENRVIVSNLGQLDMSYTPNLRPRTEDYSSPFGRSDLAGAETFVLGLNDAYTGLWRDIRVGRRKVFAPNDYFYRPAGGNSEKSQIDYDEEIMVLLTQIDSDEKLSDQFFATDFAIRTRDHLDAARNWWSRIITHAGYAIKSFDSTFRGSETTGVLSGQALKLLERRTHFTILKKRRYYEKTINTMLESFLEIDRTVYNQRWPETDWTIVWPELYPVDLQVKGEVIQALSLARAASTDTLVRMRDATLTEAEVADEVARIHQEDVVRQEM